MNNPIWFDRSGKKKIKFENIQSVFVDTKPIAGQKSLDRAVVVAAGVDFELNGSEYHDFRKEFIDWSLNN